ncbi:MAG: AAA family ATPase, partial [Bacteroidaceae bacterium]
MNTTDLKRCPVGIQTFEKVREGDYLYVDKTDLIYQLVHTATYAFLSRP